MKSKTKHQHEWQRSKPGASVELCMCGRWQHTENSGPAIVGITQSYRVESKREGHSWRMDDDGPAEAARWMTYDAAELKRQQLVQQYPSMAFRIISEEGR